MREKYPPMKSSMTSDKPIHEEFNVDDEYKKPSSKKVKKK